jgi:hypothetical protein
MTPEGPEDYEDRELQQYTLEDADEYVLNL